MNKTMENVLTVVMKGVAEALKLDSEGNKTKEAYCKYLECVSRITTKLLKDIRDGGVITIDREVERYVRLGHQCMERVLAIVTVTGNKQINAPVPSNKEGNTNVMSVSAPSTPSGSRPPLQSVFPGKDLLSSDGEHADIDKKQNLSPMAMAYKKNEQLRAAYKARLESLQVRKGASVQLSLTIQRKIMENLAIAKAQEDALQAKMKERQERLHEEAERRFLGSTEMSAEEEREKKEFYKKVLEYEQDHRWLSEYRGKLQEAELEVKEHSVFINRILECTDHPITQKMKGLQYKLYEKIYPLVYDKIDHIAQIKVPLPKYLHPEGISPYHLDVLSAGISSDEEDDDGNSDECKQEDDDEVDDDEEDDDDDDVDEDIDGQILNSSDTNSKVKQENNQDVKLEEDKKEKEDLTRSMQKENTGTTADRGSSKADNISTMETTCGQVRKDIEKSLSLGEKLQAELKLEKQKTKEVIRQISATDYEAYNCENMDDLFDDDDEEEEEEEEEGCEDGDKVGGKEEESHTENSLTLEKDKVSEGNNNDEQHQVFLVGKHGKNGVSERNDGKWRESESKDNLSEEMCTTELHQPESDGTERDCYQPTFEEGEQSGHSKINQNDSVPVDNQSKEAIGVSGVKDSEFTKVKLEKSHSLSSGGVQAGGKPVAENIHAMHDVLTSMKNEAYHRHLKGISEDVHIYLEKVLSLLFLVYDQLNTPSGQDMCYACVEKVFFKPIWKYLLVIYRLANEPKEIAVAYVMTYKENSLPKDFHVTKKLCLDERENTTTFPYQNAVKELQNLCIYQTLLGKLECIVKVSKVICQCIEDYYKGDNQEETKKPSIGADDLLPILCYVIVRTGQPQIVSECHLMQDFIHEGYIMGEEGYCLTSFQTALSYLTSLGIGDDNA